MKSEFDPGFEIDSVLADIKQKNSSETKELNSRSLNKLSSRICIALSILSLLWILFNINPSYGSVASATGSGNKINLANQLELYMNNAASDALGNLAYIRKIYTYGLSFSKKKPYIHINLYV